jgi:hypothetical protein
MSFHPPFIVFILWYIYATVWIISSVH